MTLSGGRTGLVLSVLLALACSSTPPQPTVVSTTPTPGGTQSSPGATESETPPPSSDIPSPEPTGPLVSPEPAAVQPFPGIYTTSQLALAGSDTYASFVSILDCPTTEAMLSAGDWTSVAGADLRAVGENGPQVTGTRWVLLSRGDTDFALLRLQGHDSCIGTVERLARKEFRASGGTTVAGMATAVPYLCLETADGRVSVIELYDIDGGWIGRVDVTLIPSVGSHPIKAADFGSAGQALSHTGKSLFELLAAGTDLSGEADLEAGDGFSGEVAISGLDPLSGTVSLHGLANSAGGSADLDVPLNCHITPWRGVISSPAPVSGQGINLHLTATLDVSGDFGTQATTDVDIVGTLAAVTDRRLEGTITATGSGTFNETDYSDPNFSSRCTGEWTGTQEIDVAGEIGDGTMKLTFAPAGPPVLTFSKPCNVDARESEPTLPFAYTLSGYVDVAWPPGSPATDHQVIDVPIEGLGNDHWDVTFTSAQ